MIHPLTRVVLTSLRSWRDLNATNHKHFAAPQLPADCLLPSAFCLLPSTNRLRRKLDPSTHGHDGLAARDLLSRSKPRLGCRQWRHTFGDNRRRTNLEQTLPADQRQSARRLLCERKNWLAGSRARRIQTENE